MADFIQKLDLKPSSFKNTGTAANNAITVNTDAGSDVALAILQAVNAAAVTPAAVLTQVQAMSPAQIEAMCAKLDCAPTAAALTQSLLSLSGSGVVGSVLAISATGVASWVPDKQTEVLASGPGYRAIRHSDGTIAQTGRFSAIANSATVNADIVFPIQFPSSCTSFVASVGIAVTNYNQGAVRTEESSVSYGVPSNSGVMGQIFAANVVTDTRYVQWIATGY